MTAVKQRLESLDVLRGFDLFMLVFMEPAVKSFARATGNPKLDWMIHFFDHIGWHGFNQWDLVMPLFMFMSGITIPFALSKYKRGSAPKSQFWARIIKRFVILFILGAMVQGNLLDFDLHTLRLYSNTLQAIAVGYVVAAILYVYSGTKFQIGACIVLFLTFILVVATVGHGSYERGDNIVEAIDRAVLGRFQDGVTWENGVWKPNLDYHYTWIFSSVNFAVTSMLGMFTGMVLKTKSLTDMKKFWYLLAAGAAMIAVALLLDPVLPIIKHIWSSTMVLLAGGLSVVLMAITYFLVDIKKRNKGIEFLKYYGMNAIVAYCGWHLLDFSSAVNRLLHGTAQWVGDFYPFVVTFSRVLILFFILRYLYKHKIFIRA